MCDQSNQVFKLILLMATPDRRSLKDIPIDPKHRWLMIFVILSCIAMAYYHLFLEFQRFVGDRTMADVVNDFYQDIYKLLKSLW